MKMKALATAVALTLSAGAANAAIVQGTATDGELFLSVWDPSAETSYHLDLGITVSQFNADDASPRSFDLASDANYAMFLGQTDLRYSITGANNIPFATIADLQTYGFMTTASDLTAFDASMVDQGSIDGASVNINTQAALLNAAEGAAYSGSNGGINNSADVAVGQQGYFNVATWGNTMGNLGFTMTADVDSSIAFYQVTLSDTNFTDAVITGMSDWNLSSDGTLTYGAVSAVPVPAAVWLFGSGLIGLAGIARRKKA